MRRLLRFFDTLHDMGDTVAAARHAGEVLAPDGTVMLVEPLPGFDGHLPQLSSRVAIWTTL